MARLITVDDLTRLLIVDESALALELLPERIVRELGWEVVTAASPDCLEQRIDDNEPFDVALVDLTFANSERTGLDVLLTIY